MNFFNYFFGTNINFKSDNILNLIILFTFFVCSIYSCRFDKKNIKKNSKKNNIYERSEKSWGKKYKIEACNQKLELNQPVFLLEWAFYKPVTMLE